MLYSTYNTYYTYIKKGCLDGQPFLLLLSALQPLQQRLLPLRLVGQRVAESPAVTSRGVDDYRGLLAQFLQLIVEEGAVL